jgi:zinc/manganese transport system substrate-binding protein
MKRPPFRSVLRAAVLLALGTLFPGFSAALEIASLHPLVGDMAREIGGDRVTVVEWIGPGDNPHEFDPSPRALGSGADAELVLASGKGLESSYLDKIRELLSGNQRIVETGRRVHSLVAADGNPAPCCAHHRHSGVVDPHWWHDPDNMRRAARDLADAMAEADPENADFYRANADRYREELARLDDWVENRLAEIPPERRVLATSHLAFGYFCRKYDFTAVGIQGLNREDSPSPKALGEIIAWLRENDVPAIFPEVGANPKALRTIAAESGIPLGDPLYADGTGLPPGEGYAEMMRANVDAIVRGLAP